MQPPQSKNKIYLTGFMGVAKTSVGRCLAEKLDVGFYDLDELTEKKLGQTVAKIFEEHGEAVFRDWESTALSEVSGRSEPLVVALGGGTLLRHDNGAKIEATGIRVHLKASWVVLLERLKNQKRLRPLLNGKMELDQLRLLWDKRKEQYEKCEIEYLTDGQSVDEVAAGLFSQWVI